MKKRTPLSSSVVEDWPEVSDETSGVIPASDDVSCVDSDEDSGVDSPPGVVSDECVSDSEWASVGGTSLPISPVVKSVSGISPISPGARVVASGGSGSSDVCGASGSVKAGSEWASE